MDSHRCGDCHKEFDSFENFLIHKLLIEKYKMTIEPSGRIPGLRLPRFIKTTTPTTTKQEKSSGAKVDAMTSSSLHAIGGSAKLAPIMSERITVSSAPPDDVNDISKSTKCIVEEDEEVMCGVSLDCGSIVSQEVDVESDDNVSVWSQTESLRIDESSTAKDISSPLPDVQSELDPKLTAHVCCKHCGRYYKNKIVLRVHEETVHNSDRPHVCPNCKQAFKTKGSLVRHVRTHTGERPFRCNDCGRAFHDSGSLCRHISKVHQKSETKPRDMKVLITRLLSEDLSVDKTNS